MCNWHQLRGFYTNFVEKKFFEKFVEMFRILFSAMFYTCKRSEVFDQERR